MTRPTYDMTQKAKALITAVRDADDGRHRPLVERLGALFPESADFAWLDEQDRTVELVFTSAEGGWLEPDDDGAFWRAVAESARVDLVTLLERLVDDWHAAAWRADEPDTDEHAVDEHAATDADVSEPPDAGPRFLEVEPVPGDDHTGWWRGYDRAHGVWKYIRAGEQPPADDSPGWRTHIPAAVPARQQLDLGTAVDEAAAAAIADVRALGVTADQMSDEDVIDALRQALADELSAG